MHECVNSVCNRICNHMDYHKTKIQIYEHISCCICFDQVSASLGENFFGCVARPYIGAQRHFHRDTDHACVVVAALSLPLQGRLSAATTTHAWYVSLRKCLWRLYKITFRNEKYALGRVRYWLNLPLFQFLLTFELTCRESVFVWILQPFSSEH